MNKYVRLCKGVNDKGILINENQVWDFINDDKDYYQSVYYYNEEQFQQFSTKGTIKGIKDVTTNKLVFDFDNKEDPDKARQDALILINRLTNNWGIKRSDIACYFSGNKGYNVVLELKQSLTPKQAGELAISKFGVNLPTLDASLYDAAQILRIPGTKHQVSGLYKIPLTTEQLFQLKTFNIKELALSLDNVTEEFSWDLIEPKEGFYDLPETKEVKKEEVPDSDLDLSRKPSNWKNCKWSLMQGNFDAGNRHNALTILAATCRGLGYDKETTYYMCKSALKKQAIHTGQEEFSKEELWTNIINDSIFADGWSGGQYSCKSDPWLKKYCNALGDHKCKDDVIEKPCVNVTDMASTFTNYATNFEQNIIKTGLKKLDDNVMFLASTLVGVLGNPGSGKSSLSINYLRNTSLNNVPSVFLSLDMGEPIVFAKLIQKKVGCSFKEALNLFKTDPKEAEKIVRDLKEEYKNVSFNFKAGLTVEDIKNIVKEQENNIGRKVKLVIIDYLECLAGPYSDATANTGFISNQLKDLANDLNVCVLLLLQTQKHSTPDISDPLLSLKNVKGSSIIEQSCSTILTLWREGYSPEHVEDDRYISFAVVKNRFGSLWRGDFRWDGMTGDIRELTEEETSDLKNFKELKRMEKMKKLKDDAEWN